MNQSTTEDILFMLNNYEATGGDNIWQDVIRSLPLDEPRTERLDPTGRSDAFALTDGRVFGWDESTREWGTR